MTLSNRQSLLFRLGLTAALLGYFLAWTPLAPAGLRLPGFEMGEWVKFLPQVQLGETPSRNWFYAPPLLIAVLLLVYTGRWPNRRWQTWAGRLLAVGISLLALPALQIIRLEPAPEWRLRVGLIALVVLLAAAAPLLQRLPAALVAGLTAGLALLGAVGPTWAYLGVRPAIAFWLAAPVGVGPGVLVSLFGFLLLSAVAGSALRRT